MSQSAGIYSLLGSERCNQVTELLQKSWESAMAEHSKNSFEAGLDRRSANFVPLSPVSFLTRAAAAFAEKVAVIDGERRYSYRQLLDRCVRLACGLSKLGVGRLDTVAIIASNIPEIEPASGNRFRGP